MRLPKEYKNILLSIIRIEEGDAVADVVASKVDPNDLSEETVQRLLASARSECGKDDVEEQG
jgi:hypothetical protein